MRHDIDQRLSELRHQTNYKEVQNYKQTLIVKSLIEARWTLSRMWLQLTKEIPNTQKVMMTEKPSLPKNWIVTSRDSYKKEDKGKKKETLDGEDFYFEDFWRPFLGTSGTPTTTWEPERKSYWTLRLRESLTFTSVPNEENQRTARTTTC